MKILGFGAIEDTEALEIIAKNFEEIKRETDSAMERVNKSRESVNGRSGAEIMRSIINQSKDEIRNYIIKNALDISPDYPFDDPYVYVSCSIYYRYVKSNKSDKKEFSKALVSIGKYGVQGLVDEIIRTYCDNIQKSMNKTKAYGNKDKEAAIGVLAEGFTYYTIYERACSIYRSNNFNGTSNNSNGFQRRR